MKITGFDVNLSSSESYQKVTSLSEKLDVWTGDEGREDPALSNGSPPAFIIDLSPEGKELSSSRVSSKEEFRITLSDKDKRLIALLEAFFEKLTGKKYRFMVPKDEEGNGDYTLSVHANGALQQAAASDRVGWGLIYERHESIQESQSFSFEGRGQVKTADGREISFDLNLNMSRTFISENHLSLRAGDALKDPLVINYGSPAALLGSGKINIDIDNDGTEDQISNLASGSGFLALDKNEDGTINDGSELFGPTSGNGFQDLSAYDGDGNQWIDENDPIFNKLRIWSVDDSGNSRLVALGEQGVGAIYLGSVSTAFDLKSSGSTDGKIQRSGVFLNENGSAGTIQHVDLKI